ncbi:MAG: urea ABC transporter permease subunit UrtB [Alphaproteobacteria bacterium]|nr:urea ABC transporter permease subunit UrtB [Alphaproteobacteria bacterium]
MSCVRLRLFAILAAIALLSSVSGPANAAEDLRPLVDKLGLGDFEETARAVDSLAATGDARAAPLLEALANGDLNIRKSDGRVVIAIRDGADYKLADPLDGAALGVVPAGGLDRIRINNSLRRNIRAAIGALTLRSPDPSVRRGAAEAVFKSRDAGAIEILDAAIAAEQDSGVRRVMEQARAATILAGNAPESDKLAAIDVLAARGDRDALALLNNVEINSQGALKDAAATASAKLTDTLAIWGMVQNVWYGLSLGSVLLLAAIGLAVTFGVMGVINMAHGEMVMLGAYTAFVVQSVVREFTPELYDLSLVIALPLAFLFAGGVGVLIERSIIRWLYGRPLETLLATWGLSLVLQQAVRTVFGATNQEVSAPSWMAGAFAIGQIQITWGRLWIVILATMVFVALVVVLRKTSFGLQMRAVTQNRSMASSMGIRTPWVDAMTFGLGSGIAGIAGVALSQIDNVSPNLGQSYIIDSFMVVVFGGVGNLWGTLVGALTLGIVNKLLEPYAGAVFAKVFVLVFIILFIQKRPRGLLALRGRVAEA